MQIDNASYVNCYKLNNSTESYNGLKLLIYPREKWLVKSMSNGHGFNIKIIVLTFISLLRWDFDSDEIEIYNMPKNSKRIKKIYLCQFSVYFTM